MREEAGSNDRYFMRGWLPTIVALTATLGALVIGIRYGTFAASDTDPYGYVSQAELIASGKLRVDQRFALSLPWREAEASFIPAGYKRAPVEGFIVPTYPAGLPLVMAVLLRVSANRDAVYYAVPLLGALLVWTTARLGVRLYSRWLGAAAAWWLVASPPFVLQVTQPVSDVPAAAWWTLSLLLVLHTTRWAALGAGAAASMAILTRPNLVSLAAAIGAFYLWRLWRAAPSERRRAWMHVVLFLLATIPGCVAVAALNNYLYGSPLSSGYAPFHELYQWKHVPFNLDRYPRWLLQIQTPFIYLGLAAPFLTRDKARAWLLAAFAGGVILPYIPYGYFGYDDWGYLRFLLPGYPALMVLSLFVGGELLRRATHRHTWYTLAATAGVLALVVWEARLVARHGVLNLREPEQRYVTVGRYVAAAMPRNAVYISSLHAGSIRHYSGQPTINFSTLHPRALADALASLVAMGRRPYIVIEEGEEPEFKWRFDTYTDVGKLDWPPSIHSRRGPQVRIYDPAERGRFMAGEPVVTYDIEYVGKPIVTENK
jgi:hypothetical protein